MYRYLICAFFLYIDALQAPDEATRSQNMSNYSSWKAEPSHLEDFECIYYIMPSHYTALMFYYLCREHTLSKSKEYIVFIGSF